MDFFRSVFSDEPEPSDDSQNAPTSPSNSQSPPDSSPSIPAAATAWTLGSALFKTLASKSENVIENYRRDLQEFSSGLKKETATIREAASRAVKDLPSRLETGAAVAQESLESVGQAIDTIGAIIAQGKDAILAPDDDVDSDGELSETTNRKSRDDQMRYSKPYSRIDALLRAIQCDVKTYLEEPEDSEGYKEWKLGFVLEDKNEEIENLVSENRVIGEIYNEFVPSRVDPETFWSRYFYRVDRVKKAEEARLKLVKRAISGEEEEELSWDVDDDDDEEENANDEVKVHSKSKNELPKEVEESEKKLERLTFEDGARSSERGNDDRDSVSGTRSEGGIEVRGGEGESSGDRLGLKSEDKVSSEGKNDNSDFSVVSSQQSSHEEEDLGWDEIDDIASGDEIKVAAGESPSRIDLRKRPSTAEQEEELTWDIEDDDEPVKS